MAIRFANGHDDGDPTSRLEALADAIEPFAERLDLPHLNVKCCIDIVYHVTPQHVGGITGEFDWFRCPAKLMSRISGWGLDVSYESFWFDHPDWQRLNTRGGELYCGEFRGNSNLAIQTRDNNTLHTEPRAARRFLLARLSPRPGER